MALHPSQSRTIAALTALAVCWTIAAAAPAAARPRATASTPAPLAAPARHLPTQRGGMSLEDAVQRALQERPGGRVVRAVTLDDGGRRVHEVRILLPPDEGGRVVTLRYDAGEGR